MELMSDLQLAASAAHQQWKAASDKMREIFCQPNGTPMWPAYMRIENRDDARTKLEAALRTEQLAYEQYKRLKTIADEETNAVSIKKVDDGAAN